MRRSAKPVVLMNIRLPGEMHDRLLAESEAMDTDKSAWIREAIQERFHRIDQKREEAPATK